jgi:hypothetical protein
LFISQSISSPFFLGFIEELDIGFELEEIDPEVSAIDVMLRSQLLAQ